MKWLESLLLISFISFAAAETYYATTSQDIPCPQPGAPCYTLSQYAAMPSGYFNDYTILILMSGSHSLNANFFIRGIQDLTIVPPSPYLTSVTCEGAGMFAFQDIQYIHISDMDLTGCTHSIESVQEFTLEGSKLRGQVNKSYEAAGLELRNVNKGQIDTTEFLSFVRDQQNFSTGGALMINNSGVNLINVKFEANQANVGGAVYITQNSTVNIEDCVFTSNLAVGDNNGGGAIYVHPPHNIVSKIDITRSYFDKNIGGSGGAIYAGYLTDITISHSKFTSNKAPGWGGGAAYIFGNSTITDCTFLDNEAVITGGALDIETVFYTRNVTLSYCVFHGNSAQDGGAGGFNSATIQNCAFSSNRAKFDGGAILNTGGGGYFDIYNSSFDANYADRGGAILSLFIALYLTGNTFSNNYAHGKGSAIYAYSESLIINMTDTKFLYNTGSVSTLHFLSNLYQNQATNVYGYLDIEGNKGNAVWLGESHRANIAGYTTFTNNTGGFYVNGGELTFNGTTEFRDNTYQPSPSNETNTSQAAAVSCLNGNVTFLGTTKILYDPGVHGGPIASVGCTVSMTGNVTIQNSETILQRRYEDSKGKDDTVKVVDKETEE